MKKEVCRRCYEGRRVGWDEAEEKLWNLHEMCWCPVGVHGITDMAKPSGVVWWCGSASDVEPPRGCLFFMEHVVLSQEEKPC